MAGFPGDVSESRCRIWGRTEIVGLLGKHTRRHVLDGDQKSELVVLSVRQAKAAQSVSGGCWSRVSECWDQAAAVAKRPEIYWVSVVLKTWFSTWLL